MKSNHNFHSPLRYPGGKGMLANFIKTILTENNLLDGSYVEVYAGGAGIAWALLFEEFVTNIYINDLDYSVFAFWNNVLNDTDELCKLINDSRVTMSEWNRQRAIQQDSNNHSQLELAFSTFFLNRTNRSGILNAGVIGGKHQTGKWKLDARFNKSDLISRIQKIALYRNRIKIFNLDAIDFIEHVLPLLPQNTLVYLDPPYYQKGQDLYQNHYQHSDHSKIANKVINCITQPWIVSYDRTPETLALYNNSQKIEYSLSYSAQVRYAGSEIMFFSDNLKIPPITNPTQIKPRSFTKMLF